MSGDDCNAKHSGASHLQCCYILLHQQKHILKLAQLWTPPAAQMSCETCYIKQKLTTYTKSILCTGSLFMKQVLLQENTGRMNSLIGEPHYDSSEEQHAMVKYTRTAKVISEDLGIEQ